MRGNKMTFPFSGKFKFILLKSMREDDMTSSTIKNLNGVLQFNSFKYLHLLLYFSSPRNTPKNKFLQARKSGGK